MITAARTDQARLLTPAEVAALFRVDVKTVTRWANLGRLTSIRTLGGHRRFREDEIHEVLHGSSTARLLPAPNSN
jgi:excisionase family DNA binding protein